MTEQEHELLNRYEESLRKSLTEHLTSLKALDGRLLEVEELNEKWRSSAPSYMADAVPEIAKYPLVAVAWAMYEGMGAAVLWDKEWSRYEATEDFHTMFTGPRGFDCMDEYITEVLMCLPLGSDEANKLEDLVRSTAERAQSLIRKEQIEAQSVMAFHIFARTTKVMFEAGVAVALRRMGYNYVKVNADVVS
ncbi:MAG: hypothetical protein IKT66_02365 [Alistipes sp.]|nr:hypothetical protein [Alistipes sp.]MBR5197958.1 hypothetical protein [Alistipes sp.]MBR5584811.1 hypothetical protein [Alistipes sp.]MBR6544242.1 hypothetical protein [Alistipes sp.]